VSAVLGSPLKTREVVFPPTPTEDSRSKLSQALPLERHRLNAPQRAGVLGGQPQIRRAAALHVLMTAAAVVTAAHTDAPRSRINLRAQYARVAGNNEVPRNLLAEARPSVRVVRMYLRDPKQRDEQERIRSRNASVEQELHGLYFRQESDLPSQLRPAQSKSQPLEVRIGAATRIAEIRVRCQRRSPGPIVVES